MTTASTQTTLRAFDSLIHATATSIAEGEVRISITVQDNSEPYASKAIHLTPQELAIFRHQLSLVLESI